MTPTWTYLPDIPDVENLPVDLEGEQRENLQEQIGLVLWAWLQDMEDGR